jgi:hypothetical protein
MGGSAVQDQPRQKTTKLGVVVHVYNPSCVRGGLWSDTGPGQNH